MATVSFSYQNHTPADIPVGQDMDSLTLYKLGLKRPEFINRMTLLPDFKTMMPFLAVLTEAGAYTKDLSNKSYAKSKGYNVINSNARNVTSTRVEWEVQSNPMRKLTFAAIADCDAYAITTTGGLGAYTGTPGLHFSEIFFYSSIEWIMPKDVIMLEDMSTMIHVVDDNLPEPVSSSTGETIYRYIGKIMSDNTDSYVDPDLLAEGRDFIFAHTAFEEFSKTSYTKATFNTSNYSDMGIQRFGFGRISGTAEAVDKDIQWLKAEIGGQSYNTWIGKTKLDAMQTGLYAKQMAMVYGRSTVSPNQEVLLKDRQGNPIRFGNGLLNARDGVLKYQIPSVGITKKFIDTICRDASQYSDQDGIIRLHVFARNASYFNFTNIMKDYLITSYGDSYVENDSDGKGINFDTQWYQYQGVRFIPHRWQNPKFDVLPGAIQADGFKAAEHEMVILNLGNIKGTQKNIEELVLRPTTMGVVNGMNKGGDNMANSVDGSSGHMIFENGLAVYDRNSVIHAKKFVA